MKKYLLGILIAICAAGPLKADVFSYTFRFNESDFAIIPSKSDSLNVVSVSTPAIYPDISEPGIPTIGRSIAITENVTIKNYSVSFNKRLIRHGVDLSNATQPIPTNLSPENMPRPSKRYNAKIYPDSNCVLAKNHQIGGIRLVHFLVTPFVFDATKRDLYFVDSLQVHIEIQPNLLKKAPASIRPNQIELIQSIVENKEVLDNVPMMLSESAEEQIDYLIITNEKLKYAFMPLAEWKRKKGVPSKIVTVEEIDKAYSGRTQQIRIKACIKDMAEKNSIQFVLLGGDVNIVPSQPCYVNSFVGKPDSFICINDDCYPKEYYIEEDIPADVYYSCMEDLDWDTNADGRVGELKVDQIDVTPSLFVTRAPVRNVTETESFVNRIIEYEKSPEFLRSLFQSGTRLNDIIKGETLADMFFNEVIVGKIRMGSNKLFDTYTYSGQPLSSQSFSGELNKGYQFAEVISHGLETSWCYDGGKSIFNVQDASKLNNTGHTLLTTMACSTNAFDQPETDWSPNPCLSEALFRNPNSGIIGYLGSSRFGWFNGWTPTLDLSMAYETFFYERLLDYPPLKPAIKHFGALVTFTKTSLLSYLDKPVYRWLHYSINAIGDPETPIFNTYPKSFSTATAKYNSDGVLVVNTGVDDTATESTKICVSHAASNSYYEIGYGRECSFNTGQGYFDVWITRQNYIPKYFRVIHIPKITIVDSDSIKKIDETKILSISPNPTTSNITIKYNTAFINPILKVSLTEVNGSRNYIFDITGCENEATIDISNIPNGIYIVNLIENGTLIQSSERLIKQ